MHHFKHHGYQGNMCADSCANLFVQEWSSVAEFAVAKVLTSMPLHSRRVFLTCFVRTSFARDVFRLFSQHDDGQQDL